MIFILVFLSFFLSGCAVPLLLFGGVATTAVISGDPRTAGTMLEDEGIEMNVRASLNAVPEIRNEAHINVTSYNHVVLLSGEAPSAAMRNRAETNAKKIPSVRRLYNQIVIAQPSSFFTRSLDSFITMQVKARISESRFANSNMTKVVTENGVVFLIGILKRVEADAAAEAARVVPNVVKVMRAFEYLD